jgi:hypothetical protein
MGEKALETYAPKLVAAEHRIQRYSEALLRKIGPRKAGIAVRRLGNAESDKTIASRAIGAQERNVKVGKFAGKTVPLVFCRLGCAGCAEGVPGRRRGMEVIHDSAHSMVPRKLATMPTNRGV